LCRIRVTRVFNILRIVNRQTNRRHAADATACVPSKQDYQMIPIIRLTELPGILRAAGYSKLPPYRSLYAAAIDGEIPARTINRIWHADIGDLDTIASVLGLQQGGRENAA
jgi:hypothetical protein